MSQDQINVIIGRAATDSEFRKLLKESPDEALKEYSLTEEETDALKKMNFESLDAFAGDLDDRISKRRRTISVI
jgi:hypothetical protein